MPATSVKDLLVRYGMDATGFITGAKKAAAAQGDLNASLDAGAKSAKTAGDSLDSSAKRGSASSATASAAADKHRKSLDDLASTSMKAGAVMVAAWGYAVKSTADFDAAMSSVKVNSGATGKSLEQMRAAAVKAGADTKYSATEAAQGMDELAKAGISTKDILSGGLKGALNLAAAGQIGVAQAAETTASALNQFGLKGAQASHVADLLSAGANKAQGGVGELGQALNQSGLIAHQTGLSIEETTGALAAFASKGLMGSDAGTSFKTMLQRLTPQSKEAQDAMDKLGVSAYDSQGHFIGLAKFAGNLQGALHNLTPEQRNAAMATIFGSDSVRAANILYEEGEAGVRKWTKAVDDQGNAARTAAGKMDNLKGDLEQFKGSLETALIGGGEGSTGALRGLVQDATAVVNAFNSLPDPVKNATVEVVGFGGATLVALGGAVKIGKSMADTFGALKTVWQAAAQGVTSFIAKQAEAAGGAEKLGDALGTATGKGIAGFAKMGLAVTAVAAGAVIMGEAIKSQNWWNARTVDDATDALKKYDTQARSTQGSITDLDKYFKGHGAVTGWTSEKIKDLGEAMQVTFKPSTSDNVAGFFDNLDTSILGIQRPTSDLADSWKNLDKAMASAVNSGSATQAQAAFKQLADEAEKQGISLDDLKKKFPEYEKALKSTKDAQSESVTASAKYTSAMTDGISTTQDMTKATEDLVKAQQAYANQLLGEMDAQVGYNQAVADATKAQQENGATLDLTTQKGRDNQSALDNLASSTLKYAQQSASAGESLQTIQGIVDSGKQAWIAQAESMGMTAGAAQTLADKLFDVSQIKTTIDTTAAQQSVSQLTGTLDAVPKTMTTTLQANGAPLAAGLTDAQAKISGVPTATMTQIKGDATSAIVATNQANAGLSTIEKVRTVQVNAEIGNLQQGVATALNQLARIPTTKTVTVSTINNGYSAAQNHAAGFSTGGSVWGAGTSTSDSIPAWLSNREFVVKAASTDKVGRQALEYINRHGRLPQHYAAGGYVQRVSEQRITNNLMSASQPNLGPVMAALDAVNNRPVQVELTMDRRVLARAVSTAQRATYGV